MSEQDRGHPPFPSIFDKKAMAEWALDPVLEDSVMPFTSELFEALDQVDPGADGLPEAAWQVAHAMQKVLLGGQQRRASKAKRPGRKAASLYAAIRPEVEAEAMAILARNPGLSVNAVAGIVEERRAASGKPAPDNRTMRRWITLLHPKKSTGPGRKLDT
jgi:hypothetical protein